MITSINNSKENNEINYQDEKTNINLSIEEEEINSK